MKQQQDNSIFYDYQCLDKDPDCCNTIYELSYLLDALDILNSKLRLNFNVSKEMLALLAVFNQKAERRITLAGQILLYDIKYNLLNIKNGFQSKDELENELEDFRKNLNKLRKKITNCLNIDNCLKRSDTPNTLRSMETDRY